MGVTERLNSKGNAYCIVLFATILFVMLAICIPISIYAEGNDLVINPGSISGVDDKEGNVLAEYGFAVFTEESMLNMQAIKNKKEKDSMQMVSGLFQSEWEGFADYDQEVKEVIELGSLFENVDTGAEMADDDGINRQDIQKWSMRIVAVILMCIMSAVAVRWSRKRYANNYNNRNR